jgi:peptidyl-prolyl cis-trans isomerase B (cyclophilin B)
MITFKTTHGDIVIDLHKDKTPNTVNNFIEYVKAGFYQGTIFHRVIPGFVIQGGGFEPGMMPKKTFDPIENEAQLGKSNLRGTLSMARTNDPHSASSQFFINLADNVFLDYKKSTQDGFGYCVFGEVIEGMDIVDKIAKLPTTNRQGHQDVPQEDVVIMDVIMPDSLN